MAGLIDYYNPAIWNDPAKVGNPPFDNTQLVAPFDKGLLHFIYWATYTLPGRTFMHAIVPGAPQGAGQPPHTEATVRQALSVQLGVFGVTERRHDVCIEVHIAGVNWVLAYNEREALIKNPNALPADIDKLKEEMDTAESNMKQQVAAITWFLWEDATGPLFPLPW